MNVYLSKKIGVYLPKIKITNEDISKKFPEWTSDNINEKVGIEKRHHIDKDEDTITMAINACNSFFTYNSQISKNSIDYIILITSSPRNVLPTSACFIQNKLELKKNIGAIDINLGCSGYVYGLDLAKALVNSKQYNNILLITSESYSKYINSNDKGNLTIFGDGATCSLVTSEQIKESWIIGNSTLGTDGSGYDKLIVENNQLNMDGKAVFNFTASKVVDELKKFLNQDFIVNKEKTYVFHQANSFMINYMRKKLKIDKQDFVINMKEKGNTVSSTIPFALSELKNNKELIILAGFGVGLSWGFITLNENL